MTRTVALLVALAGCDQVFNLHRPPDDAPVDVATIDVPPDAPPRLCDFAPASAAQPIAPNKGVAIVAGSFDVGDSIDVAIATTQSGSLLVSANNGGIFSTPTAVVDIGGPALALVAGDVNQDGVVDLAFAGSGFAGAELRLPAGWEAHEAPLNTGTPRSITLANLDGTGLADLIIAMPSANELQLLLGTNEYGPGSPIQRPSKHPVATIAADLDNDTDVDIIAAIEDENGIVVYRDTGANFTPSPLLGTNMSPSALAFGTLGSRAAPDLLVLSEASDSIRVLRNDGTGVFTPDATLVVQDAPVAIALADIDGDGRADILVVNNKSESLSVYRGTDTSFEVRQDYQTVAKPVGLAVADFSGDGHPDVAVLGEDAGFVIHTQACAPP